MRNVNRIAPRQTSSFSIGLIVVLLVLSGCVTGKKTAYLQEYPESKYKVDSSRQDPYRIHTYDNLYIRVGTPDIRYSEMFNTVPSGATISTTEQSVDLLSYAVDEKGDIILPYLGSIHVEGYTAAEIVAILEKELANYVTDVSVTVKLVNFNISVLGEVTNPGRYPVFKQQMTIFEALAMAGDIDDYGNRYKLQIIRPSPDGSIIKEFDMTDKSLVDSEFYYVLPNDVVYVEPMKGKFFAMNQFPFMIVLSFLSTTILLLSWIQQ